MFTINNLASKLGAVALLLGVTFAACSDDDVSPSLRSKEFKLIKTLTDSTQVGTVKISENRDSSINLTLTLSKTVKDTVNKVYVIKGTATAPALDSLVKGALDLKGTGSAVTIDIWKNSKTYKYDSALANVSAFAKVRFSNYKDSLIAVGNVLKAGK
jgi:hypothetical protein